MKTKCLIAAYVSLFLFVSGCAAIVKPYTDIETLEKQGRKDKDGQGYVGITGEINIHNLFNTFFKLQFEFIDQATRKRHVVKVNQNYVQKIGYSGTYPIIFSLPPGTYAFKASEILVPGGIYKKTHYLDIHQQLGVEMHFPPFEVKSGDFIHIGKISVQHVQMRKDYYNERDVYYSIDSRVEFNMPVRSVWKDFVPFLKKGNPRYIRKTALGDVDFPPILWIGQDL